MVRFLKFKFQTTLKLNFNGGQFYKKYKILVISKNCEICSEIKFEIENVQHLRQKLWAENYESKILSEFKLNKIMVITKNCKKIEKENVDYALQFWVSLN